ncbi:MAG TPA: C39 family peptidase [Micromonosporaceae bacterium]
MKRRDVLRTAVLTGAAAGLVGTDLLPATTAFAAGDQPKPREIVYHEWTSEHDFRLGEFAGLAVCNGSLALTDPVGQLTYTDPTLGTTGTYDYATWTSPFVKVGFGASEAISSWNADTPGGTWIQMELRGVTKAGDTTGWYVMGRWAADDSTISRTSVDGQSDTDGTIETDTFVATSGHNLTSIQLRVTLYRPVGSGITPDVRSMGFVASKLPNAAVTTTAQNAIGTVLNVPMYSQQIHADQYPDWGGGGEAWCSPTSTSMVVAFWGKGPKPADYAWVDPSYADPWIDYAARNTYDYEYGGTGNWPFNAAYAGRFGLDAFITRLRSLNEAERFIAAGIPLVMSLSFKKDQIPGLDYSTGGHLVVLAGFDATGQPVLNDPFSDSDADVRKPVGRPEFESAWLKTSGGTVYVIRPHGKALPPTTSSQSNW